MTTPVTTRAPGSANRSGPAELTMRTVAAWREDRAHVAVAGHSGAPPPANLPGQSAAPAILEECPGGTP